MADVVHEIVTAFGGPTKLARATGLATQTVWDWKSAPANIPIWRRPHVLMAVHASRIQLSDEAIAYLASTQRVSAAA